jgi:hypothetical protein
MPRAVSRGASVTRRDTSLAAALSLLSAGLDDPSTNAWRGFDQFAVVVRSAVASYCGLAITMTADGGIPLAITATDPDAVVATSLAIPLSTLSSTDGGELVLFATVAGAFVDLATDLAYKTGTDLSSFAIDAHLQPPAAPVAGVAEFAIIHQAVGFLIAGGSTREQALARLEKFAANDGHDLAAAAARVLRREL